MTYLRRKILFYLVAAWIAITVNFAIPRMMPGNPVDILLARLQQGGATVLPQSRRALETALGRSGDGNVLVQYFEYLGNLFTGDLGVSVTYFPTPVLTVLGQALPWTLVLVGVSTLLAFVLGVGVGTFVGWHRGTWLDGVAPTTTFLSAIPYFWLALILLFLFGSFWQVFPLAGGYDYDTTPGLNAEFLLSALHHAVLPGLTIVFSSVGAWMLGMRNMMVSTLSEDYVLTAEAKGLRSRRIMLAYAARNAVLPSIAGFAISLGFVVSGSIVTEAVFSYPGVGYVLLQAVQNNDYPLMQAIFLVITLTVLGANLAVDLLHSVIDPRTRKAE
ncbi:ABC transporter permease [Actinopolyspora mortivallis]|uniref:ABC transporter permease n=1 Tax=Actinopolyspora mortivallis TaxID=33906 RepID=UPI000360577D|nr:ABC transporter permease [Actinopolyspora mortivallis]